MNTPPTARPLGLTLLAIGNFVVGGMFAIYAVLGIIAVAIPPEQTAANTTPTTFSDLLPLIVGGGALGLMGIVAGIGQIQRKRLLGRQLATAFGAIGVIAWCLLLALKEGRAFHALDVIFLSSFVANIVLVNVTFKDGFVHP